MLLSRTPTKNRSVWDLETSVIRTKVTSLHSPCDLSIAEIDIHSGNARNVRKREDSGYYIFQPDGAPAHWHLNVRRFLNEFLSLWWIRCMENEDLALEFWTPRSPDLTPCDFFLWGFVKVAVYVPPLPTNLNDLRNRITVAVNSMKQDIRNQVWDEFNYRLDHGCARVAHCVTALWRNFSHYCRPLSHYDVWFTYSDNREVLTAAPAADVIHKQAFRVRHWTSREASLRHSNGWGTEAFPLSSVICAPVF